MIQKLQNAKSSSCTSQSPNTSVAIDPMPITGTTVRIRRR